MKVTKHRVHEIPVSDFHDSITIMIKKDIPQIEKYCKIEMTDVEKSLKTIKDSLPRINEKYTRDFMHLNIAFVKDKLTGYK